MVAHGSSYPRITSSHQSYLSLQRITMHRHLITDIQMLQYRKFVPSNERNKIVKENIMSYMHDLDIKRKGCTWSLLEGWYLGFMACGSGCMRYFSPVAGAESAVETETVHCQLRSCARNNKFLLLDSIQL